MIIRASDSSENPTPTSVEGWAQYLGELIGLDKKGQKAFIKDVANRNSRDWVNILIDEDVDPEIINKFKQYFLTDHTYTVELSFNGMIGVSETIEIDAPPGLNEDSLMELLRTTYEYELDSLLELDEVTDEGDGDYEVSLTFSGYIGTETYYNVSADDEDDAEMEARNEAIWDFDIVSYVMDEEEEE